MRIRLPGRNVDRFALAALGTLALVCARVSTGQPEPPNGSPPSGNVVERDVRGAEAVPSATDGLTRLPADAFRSDPEVGVRYRTLFRDTGAPYTNELRPIEPDATARAGSVEGRIHLGLPNFRGRFPLLDRGFEPQDADIKLGPVFFKLRALSVGALASDNIEHSENNPKAGVIGIVRIGGTLYVQITEGLRFATSGNFVYLPFESKFGIAGYGAIVPFTFGLEGIPAAESQLTWDTMIAGWNVLFSDEFRISLGRFSEGARDDFALFEGGQFDESDTAGRYSFRAPVSRNARKRFRANDTEVDLLYYSNVASVTTERLLPGPVRLRIRAYHEDLWYNQGNRGQPSLRGGQGGRGQPSLREGVTVFAASERENMRFQPFVLARATHTNRTEGFNEEIRLGITGPITEQLRFSANAGVFHRDASGASRFIWGLSLHHLAGPYTTESIIAGSNYGDFSQELTNHVTYRLRQVLGPKLVGEVFARAASIEDLENGTGNREEFRTGLRLTGYLGPRTTARASGTYALLNYSGSRGQRETFTGRLELDYHFTDLLLARLIYQHQTRSADQAGDSFDENLIFLSLTKYFD